MPVAEVKVEICDHWLHSNKQNDINTVAYLKTFPITYIKLCYFSPVNYSLFL